MINHKALEKQETEISIDLRHCYPPSMSRCIKKCLLVALITITLGAFYFSLALETLPIPHFLGLPEVLVVVGSLVKVAAIILVVQFLYEMVSLRFDRYWARDGNFVLRHGIIFRETGSFPLSRITDIYITHDFIDLILGLRRVHIATASLESGSFASISGLRTTTADMFRSELQKLSRTCRMIEGGHIEFASSSSEGNQVTDLPDLSYTHINKGLV